ncbi:MAG: molybdopterin-dependent oxidoreductase [Brooklawnia sp.]|jgi:anaerobic selenocysteine-containing dehydrogenase
MTTTLPSAPAQGKARQDEWIPTVCEMCFCNCAIKVRVIDGVVVKIEGNELSPVGEGRVCGKGNTAIMQLYDPNRITKPMKRTNPIKGLDQDPGWVEISWEEAYDLAVERIKDVVDRDPKKLMYTSFIVNVVGLFAGRLLMEMTLGGQTLLPDICGAGIHPLYNLFNATGNAGPDWDYCKYVLQFGCQTGTATRHGFNMSARRFAEARKAGAKLVNVDPHMSAGAEKADRWIPIKQGTDSALALGLANVLVNELGIYDVDYLKEYTNAPYLVDTATGRFIKDDQGQPYVMTTAGEPAIFRDVDWREMELAGTFTVDGKQAKTGFQMLKEHLTSYTPEWVETITDVPAETTRITAKEFGEAACIGQTITLDGHELPYRPVAADCFSGLSRHLRGWHEMWSVFMLNTLVGSHNVVGGMLGFAPKAFGMPGTGKPAWSPGEWEPEGMLESTTMVYASPSSEYENAYKERKYDPRDMSLMSLTPFDHDDPHFMYQVQLHPERFEGQERAELLYIYATNPYKNWGNNDEMGEFLNTFKYVIQSDLYLNDASYFADLIMPEATFLERYDLAPNGMMNHHNIGGLHTKWASSIRQPVVPSRDDCPGNLEVWFELAKRLGVTDTYQAIFNAMFGLTGDLELKQGAEYSVPELLDRIYKAWYGKEHGFEWFSKNGVITWDRKVEEVYLYPFHKSRIPLYFDLILEGKEQAQPEIEKLGWDWWSFDEYVPLPEYKPCHIHAERVPGYDFNAVYYTTAFNTDTWTILNPWLNEITAAEPYGYNIEMNAQTAAGMGLKSGDDVRMSTPDGYAVEGRLILVQGVEPMTLAVSGGSWNHKSKYTPVARGKGVALNHLVPVMDEAGLRRISTLSQCFDQCVTIKLEKI